MLKSSVGLCLADLPPVYVVLDCLRLLLLDVGGLMIPFVRIKTSRCGLDRVEVHAQPLPIHRSIRDLEK